MGHQESLAGSDIIYVNRWITNPNRTPAQTLCSAELRNDAEKYTKERQVPVAFLGGYGLLGIQRLDALPDTRDAKCQLLIPLPNIHEPRLLHHLRKLFL